MIKKKRNSGFFHLCEHFGFFHLCEHFVPGSDMEGGIIVAILGYCLQGI